MLELKLGKRVMKTDAEIIDWLERNIVGKAKFRLFANDARDMGYRKDFISVYNNQTDSWQMGNSFREAISKTIELDSRVY